MNTKIIVGVVIALVVLGAGYWYVSQMPSPAAGVQEESRLAGSPEAGEQGPAGEKIGADVFTGPLEEVNEGCYADGECYIVVDGRHVTVIMGWSQEIVGTLQGVDSFGDLNAHIGENVQVYAAKNGDKYTLYGSEGFYVKLVE